MIALMKSSKKVNVSLQKRASVDIGVFVSPLFDRFLIRLAQPTKGLH